MYCLFKNSKFDYEIKDVLLGIFDTMESAEKMKEKAEEIEDEDLREEMVYSIVFIEKNTLIEE